MIKLIVEYAIENSYKYVRLDCDDREELKLFYQINGFSFVNNEEMGEFKVVKFELLVSKYREQEH